MAAMARQVADVKRQVAAMARQVAAGARGTGATAESVARISFAVHDLHGYWPPGDATTGEQLG